MTLEDKKEYLIRLYEEVKDYPLLAYWVLEELKLL